MKKISILLLLVLLQAGAAFAQFVKEWEVAVGTQNEDIAQSVIECQDRGYLVVGNIDANEEESRFKVVKYDFQGRQQWSYENQSGFFEFAKDVAQLRNGDYIVVGSTTYPSTLEHDFMVSRIDNRGNLVWQTRMGDDLRNEKAYSVVQTQDGNIVVAGVTAAKGNGHDDIWLLKLNLDGRTLWEKTLGGNYYDQANHIIENPDRSLTLIGSSSSNVQLKDDAWFLHLDANGNYISDRTHGGIASDMAHHGIRTRQGKYMLVGETASQGAGNTDMWVLETSLDGQKNWGRVYGRADDDRLHGIIENNTNEFVMVGTTRQPLSGANWQMLQIDNHGQILWSKEEGGAYDDEAMSVARTTDGGFIVAGYVRNGGGCEDMLIQKYRPSYQYFPNFNPLISSVDQFRPVPSGQFNNKALAVVIGIENYQGIGSALFAERDAQSFYEYARYTLRVPGENILYLSNQEATTENIRRAFSESGFLGQNVNEYSDVFIFFAGHGMPNPVNSKAMLVPYNVNVTQPEASSLQVDDLVSAIERMNPNSATFFLDACFSGSTRMGVPLCAYIRPSIPATLAGGGSNIAILSSSTGLEVSGSSSEQAHGLFTYYLLKGLQGEAYGHDNVLSISELASYVSRSVQAAANLGNRPQHPTFNGNNGNKILVSRR